MSTYTTVQHEYTHNNRSTYTPTDTTCVHTYTSIKHEYIHNNTTGVHCIHTNTTGVHTHQYDMSTHTTILHEHTHNITWIHTHQYNRSLSVVFTRPHRRSCSCSANYRPFSLDWCLWLVDVTALFLVMWLSLWYQFCVSLSLEVRTVGLVLFRTTSFDTAICQTLLAISWSCWACVQWEYVQCSRALQ